MSAKLIGEVLDAFSEGLKPGHAATALLYVIAHRAHHETDCEHAGGKQRDAGGVMLNAREMWCTNEEMCKQMGNTSNSSRKRAIDNLEALGLKVRVPYGYTKTGEPIYATGGPGHTAGVGRAPKYRVPTPEELRAAIDRQQSAAARRRDEAA